MMYENGSDGQDTVDPRVHIELERLNSATDEINRLEVDLDESRATFRQLLCDSTAKVDQLRLKLGSCIERAKPYYEARFCANEALKETQVAAMRYERANSSHSAAREMVYLAEQGLGGRTLDPAWQEMLNHATQRVNDAERDRTIADAEHRAACVKHEVVNARVKSLQKELKRAIAKSSLSIRRALMQMSSIAYQHELTLLPYYEMKAHFNQLLEKQKLRVQTVETQVINAKLTYADALRNLEQISDEIHQTRSKAAQLSANLKQPHKDPNDTCREYTKDVLNDYKSLPDKLSSLASPISSKQDDVDGYRSLPFTNNLTSSSNKVDKHKIVESHSTEWTEISLGESTPEEEESKRNDKHVENKPKLLKQKTLPNPSIENEYSALKSKAKLESTISNWISRSSAKTETNCLNSSRRQSLDNILGPLGEKVKESFSHGMMMLNISSLTERRNSEPKADTVEDKTRAKKIPSPLERTLSYLHTEDDNSDTESLSSIDMLTEDQINCLMLDKATICEQVLGTPISEVVPFPSDPTESNHPPK